MSDPQSTAHPAVVAYVAAVRDELGDLPPEEAAEIVEDVREHLDQVAAEYDGAVTHAELVDRLGAPAEYAAELRSSAGLAEPEPVAQPSRAAFGRRLLRVMASAFIVATIGFGAIAVVDTVFSLSGAPAMFAGPAVVAFVAATACVLFLGLGQVRPLDELRRLPGAGRVDEALRQLRAMPWGQPAIEFLGSLQTAWWVARAAVVGAAAAYLGSLPLGAAVFLLALAVSIRFGRLTQSSGVGGQRQLAVYGANAALVVGGAVVALAIFDYVQQRDAYLDAVADDAYTDEYPYGEPYQDGFGGPDGLPVDNIFAYDADGALLENVRLYDQSGNPIVLPESEPCYEGALPEETFVVTNPWGTNVYPRLTYQVDERGECGEATLDAPFGSHLPTPPAADPAPDGAGEGSALDAPRSPGAGTATPPPPAKGS
ncbi:hypothetical protein CLV30_108110 [Haloactinopolyspora alba]|uniref:Uncharacterized protein n=1 Tax=Haloactinopolyspora alba TaxID=648780 RepID=A0A2P8E161_9ACTN|nr:hypothetical protein [Haloactinopolyspora alba]PSL03198.1 hypothetical protein CLV30_108110 [Haloactinopolyspora alba]